LRVLGFRGNTLMTHGAPSLESRWMPTDRDEKRDRCLIVGGLRVEGRCAVLVERANSVFPRKRKFYAMLRRLAQETDEAEEEEEEAAAAVAEAEEVVY